MILREPAHALDPRVRTVWVVKGAIATGGVAAVGGLAVAIVARATSGGAAPWSAGAVAAGVVVATGVALFGVAPAVAHKHFRYEVTDVGFYVAQGWLWRRWKVVPHARVQTVDTRSGPLLRAFGLVAVDVTTAAAGGGTGIPGLVPAVADALVLELARRAEVDEAT